MTIAAVVLAHQGGWDEMLMVVAPIALFVLLLRIANSRAAATEDPDQPTSPVADDDPHPEEPC